MQTADPSERKWHLAMKILTDGLDPSETIEWDDYLKDSEFRLAFDAVKRNWEAFGTLPYQQINVEEDWQIVRGQIEPKHAKKFSVLLRYAAIFIFGLGVAYFLGQLAGKPDQRMTSIEAPVGTRTVITLPDSSKVWLNARSRISFDADFASTHRKVDLEGEAFFDVTHNKVPFSIHTIAYDITVLGTAFNVKAYRDDKEAVTTLVRGSLRVERTTPFDTREQVVLKPNEKVILSDDKSAFVVKKDIDAESESAWKDGWLSVRGESLYELARKIERLYDVKINFQDPELESYRYTGRIRQLSLEQVLKALALTSPVEFTIEEKVVVLRENKKTKEKYQSVQTP
jgi:ferric-dicitrate binding protein FerR (iron transport regulator)